MNNVCLAILCIVIGFFGFMVLGISLVSFVEWKSISEVLYSGCSYMKGIRAFSLVGVLAGFVVFCIRLHNDSDSE